MVALGILASRVVGLVRQRVLAHYLGVGDAADAFTAAFRIPNLLQNLFGEGALSASFIPVYAGLLGAGNEARGATRGAAPSARCWRSWSACSCSLGVLATPFLIDLIAPGFEGDKRELTIRLVRIFFPGAGLFVLSAWCLGVLNSHRRFFLSLRRAGRVEPRDHRRAASGGAGAWARRTSSSRRPGARWWARRCRCWCSCPR